MSALSRSVCLAALVGLIAMPAFAAGEVKGPVRISASGVQDFNGDQEAFRAAMDADERNDAQLIAASDARIVIHSAHNDAVAELQHEARRVAAEARAEARRVAAEARRIADESRDEARRAADCAREAAMDAAREARINARELADAARLFAREAARTARSAALVAARDANREARRAIIEARVAMRAHGRERARVIINHRRGEIIEIHNGQIVRCSNPENHPGTGCAPFNETEKADLAENAGKAGLTAGEALNKALEALESLRDIR